MCGGDTARADGNQVENFQKAFEIIGFPHEKYMLLDYGESFYYYVLSQKREPGIAVWDGMPLHRRTCLFAR